MAWWQVYLDNFMSGELVAGNQPSQNLELLDTAMKALDEVGVLNVPEKQVRGAAVVTELGVQLDGRHGLLGSSPARLLRTIWSSLHVTERSYFNKKESQVVLGRWIFILQFRRAAMSVFLKAGDELKRQIGHLP